MKNNNEFVAEIEVIAEAPGIITEHEDGDGKFISFHAKSPQYSFMPKKEWMKEFHASGEVMKKMLSLGIFEGSRFWIHGYYENDAEDCVRVEEVSKLSYQLMQDILVEPYRKLEEKRARLDQYEKEGAEEKWLQVQRMLLEEDYRCLTEKSKILYREMGLEF